MKCPTMNCPNTITGHARRLYCHVCRQSMAYHAKKRPAEVLDYSKRLNKYLFRVEHIAERRMNILESITQHPSRNKNGKRRDPNY